MQGYLEALSTISSDYGPALSVQMNGNIVQCLIIKDHSICRGEVLIFSDQAKHFALPHQL